MGDWSGDLADIGLAFTGGATHWLYDGTTEFAGLAIDGLLPYSALGSDGSTLGNDFINWSQQGADDFVSSFGPSPLTGGWGNEELQTGFDGASFILGGASLLNPRSASIMDDIVPTPNHGSPNPGTFAGATDGEMIGQPTSPMFSNPYNGDPTAPNFVGPLRPTEPAGDIFVMIDGDIVRLGGSNNELPGSMIDNSYNDLSFYQSIQNARNIDDRREVAEAPNEILDLIKDIFKIFEETE